MDTRIEMVSILINSSVDLDVIIKAEGEESNRYNVLL